MSNPVVKRILWELFLDKKTPLGGHWTKEKALAVKRKLEDELGFAKRITCKATEVYGELVPKGTRILMP